MAERDEKGHFTKGMVGNPNGRPLKGETITDLVREYLRKEVPDGKKLTYKDLFVKKVLEKAYKGDMQAIKLLWNYIDGMPNQPYTGDVEGEININIIKKMINGPDNKSDIPS